MQGHRAFSVVILVALATGCTSPEAKRAPGGDTRLQPASHARAVEAATRP